MNKRDRAKSWRISGPSWLSELVVELASARHLNPGDAYALPFYPDNPPVEVMRELRGSDVHCAG